MHRANARLSECAKLPIRTLLPPPAPLFSSSPSTLAALRRGTGWLVRSLDRTPVEEPTRFQGTASLTRLVRHIQLPCHLLSSLAVSTDPKSKLVVSPFSFFRQPQHTWNPLFESFLACQAKLDQNAGPRKPDARRFPDLLHLAQRAWAAAAEALKMCDSLQDVFGLPMAFPLWCPFSPTLRSSRACD